MYREKFEIINKRHVSLVKTDALFLFRSGLHIIYLVITMVYLIMIRLLPMDFRDWIVPFLVFADPAMLGFFFIGSLVLIEKQQGIVDLRHITPVTKLELISGKIINLTLISLLCTTAITIGSQLDVSWLLVILAILVTSSWFSMFGYYLGLKSHSINHYFAISIPWILAIIAPCVLLFLEELRGFAMIFPSGASMFLFLQAYGLVDVGLGSIMAVISMIVWHWILYKQIGRISKERS